MVDIRRIQDLMAEKGMDAIVASTPENIFYITGLPILLTATDNILFVMLMNPSRNRYITLSVIPKEGEPVLIVPVGASGAAQEYSWVADQRIYTHWVEDAFQVVKSVLEEKQLLKGTVGVEDLCPIYKQERLRRVLPDAEFKNAAEVLDEVRMIKSDEEIKRLRRAVQVAEKAIAATNEVIREGITDLELVKTLKTTMINEGETFNQTTACTGTKSGTLAYQPGQYRLKKGDLIRYDVACVHEGYTSDIARDAVVTELSKDAEQIYGMALNAQQMAIKAIRPGVKLSNVYQVAKEAVEEAGYPMRHPHIGHSVGINVEEEPFITPGSNMQFKPNMVFAVEVFYAIPGFGGVNIEDMFLVTGTGVEMLSTMDRSIYISK